MYLIKLVRLQIRSQHKEIPFSCWPRVSMEGLLRGLLLLEKNIQKVDFTDEELNNKEVYVDHGA